MAEAIEESAISSICKANAGKYPSNLPFLNKPKNVGPKFNLDNVANTTFSEFLSINAAVPKP